MLQELRRSGLSLPSSYISKQQQISINGRRLKTAGCYTDIFAIFRYLTILNKQNSDTHIKINIFCISILYKYLPLSEKNIIFVPIYFKYFGMMAENIVNLKIKKNILQKIEDSPAHSVFFINDFTELGSAETVRKALAEATDKGMVEHIAHGIYVKPMISRFGSVPVPLEYIAMEIAKRDNTQILPTGMTAANLLGLSTQIPLSISFITTGSSRIINVGHRKINFRHAAPRQFACQGTTVPLIIQAFKELTKKNIGVAELSAVSNYIEKASDKTFLAKDILLAPQWIQSIITPIIKKYA